MRYWKRAGCVAAVMLALCLAACGTAREQEAEASAGAYQSHTFDCNGSVVDVTVDLGDDWDVEYGETTAALYDGPIDGQREPVAVGTCESGAEYEESLAMADTLREFSALENGIAYTDSVGVQYYCMDLGGGVCYRIMVRPDRDGQEIVDRYDVELRESAPAEENSIYLTLVNRTHKLPENWEDRIELQETQNYFGEPIRVEKAAYQAYQALQAALLAEGVDIQLESCYRSVERQQELWAEYEQSYGVEYCNQYVAVPGFSEHHTGFAVDTNLIQKDTQSSDEEKQKERELLWEKVHQKMPEYGFILRYLPEKDSITGYAYEPWHMRYVGDPEVARTIYERGLTLEEYLGQVEPSDATVDCGASAVYTQSEQKDAISVLRAEFDTWAGCSLHSIRYAGDGCNSPENIQWMNSLREGKQYTACIAFSTDFRSPAENSGALEPDAEYTDYQWWLARTFGGDWELLTWG